MIVRTRGDIRRVKTETGTEPTRLVGAGVQAAEVDCHDKDVMLAHFVPQCLGGLLEPEFACGVGGNCPDRLSARLSYGAPLSRDDARQPVDRRVCGLSSDHGSVKMRTRAAKKDGKWGLTAALGYSIISPIS